VHRQITRSFVWLSFKARSRARSIHSRFKPRRHPLARSLKSADLEQSTSWSRRPAIPCSNLLSTELQHRCISGSDFEPLPPEESSTINAASPGFRIEVCQPGLQY